MDVFGNALDTIIVGALALPWVLLAYHLFFQGAQPFAPEPVQAGHPATDPYKSSDTKPEVNDFYLRLRKLLAWVRSPSEAAIAGVLLFALAYFLGSAISRIAQDFSDDDDLYLHVPIQNLWLRFPTVTETSILTNVYCRERELLQPCDQHIGILIRPKTGDQWKARLSIEQTATDLFHTQEAAALLKGTDDIERLRLYHDQIMVLRGGSFDCLLAFSLALFWWCTKVDFKPSWLARALPAAVFASYFVLGSVACFNHFQRNFSEPPYMEFTLLGLALAGGYVLLRGRSSRQKSDTLHREKASPDWPGKIGGGYVFLALFLTVTAFLGWWATQELYDQQVIYFSRASQTPAQPAATQPPSQAH